MIALRQRPLFMLGLLSILGLASLGSLLVYQFPRLYESREKLDQARTQSLALEYQQTNLERVQHQLADIKNYQAELDQNVWKFESEEAFFQAWESFGNQQAANASELTVGDAIPTGQLLIRTGSVRLAGTPNEVFKAIAHVQQIKPVIGITAVRMTSPKARTVEARVEFSTIWR